MYQAKPMEIQKASLFVLVNIPGRVTHLASSTMVRVGNAPLYQRTRQILLETAHAWDTRNLVFSSRRVSADQKEALLQ